MLYSELISPRISVAEAVVSLEYPSQMTRSPVFHIDTHSQFGRPLAWIADPAGTASLRAGRLPFVLPTIHANITSSYAIAEILVAPTYHGSLDLSSRFASVSNIDHAKGIPGRNIGWQNGSDKSQQGVVQWDGRHGRAQDMGSLDLVTEYAVGRILFLGLDDDGIIRWPSE